MAIYGPFLAGSVADLGDNGAPWTNPANAIVVSNTNFASCPVNNQPTNTLEFKAFGPFPGITPLDKIVRLGIQFKRMAASNDAVVSINMQLVCNGLPAGDIITINQSFFTVPTTISIVNGGFVLTDDDVPKWNTNAFGANLTASFGVRVSFQGNLTPINTLDVNEMSIVFSTDHVEAIPPFGLTAMSQPIITRYDPVATG